MDNSRKSKKHKKGWGPGNPLYDWRAKGGKPGKRKGKRGKRKGKKMPANVVKYMQLRGQGKSKAEARRLAGLS